MADLATKVEVLEIQITELLKTVAELAKPRDRGPKSESSMTEEQAFRCKFGDLVKATHKDAAEKLHLSYGQIFSCRGGYTFKQVNKDWTAKVEVPEGEAA